MNYIVMAHIKYISNKKHSSLLSAESIEVHGLLKKKKRATQTETHARNHIWLWQQYFRNIISSAQCTNNK